MMERFDISAQDLKSFGFTTLFCIVIALATMSIWGGLFGEHLAISFSYGYSAFFFRAMDCTALAGTIKTFGEYLIFKLCGGAGYQQRLSMAAPLPGL